MITLKSIDYEASEREKQNLRGKAQNKGIELRQRETKQITKQEPRYLPVQN